MSRPLLHRIAFLAAGLFLPGLVLVLAGPARAQDFVELGSTAYVDYYYNASSPNPAAEGQHGFTYRRLYLTADFTLSNAISARARLEANDGTTGPKGPIPFVKDLWVRWESNAGHAAILGVTPPPVFETAEDVWDYRSLEKTVLDLVGLVDSRDFGLRVEGPIALDGRLQYAAMYANNSASLPEMDKYKRGYAQLLFFPNEALAFTVDANVAGYDDQRETGVVVHGLAGYSRPGSRVGIEIFWSRTTVDSDAIPTEDVSGTSLFVIQRITSRVEAVGRFDRVRLDAGPIKATAIHLVGGLSFQAHENIRLIPNVIYHEVETVDEPSIQPRVTLELDI